MTCIEIVNLVWDILFFIAFLAITVHGVVWLYGRIKLWRSK